MGRKKGQSKYSSGMIINDFTLIEDTGLRSSGTAIWKVQCPCKKIFDVRIRSCGCYKSKVTSERGRANRGPKNVNYNKDIPDSYRIAKRQTPEDMHWKKEVYKRDNYQCQICLSNEKIRAHHLNGWLWAINERYDINNGITLCYDCHRDFHSIYGVGKNTKEQFIEFITKIGEL